MFDDRSGAPQVYQWLVMFINKNTGAVDTQPFIHDLLYDVPMILKQFYTTYGEDTKVLAVLRTSTPLTDYGACLGYHLVWTNPEKVLDIPTENQ